MLVRSVEDIENIYLFVIGKGEELYKRKVENIISKLHLEQTVFLLPPIPNKEVLHAVNSSNIGVCFYNEKHFNSYFCASNKLYEYLNLGVKVLTNNTAGVARVIRHRENGYCCDVINAEEIRRGIQFLIQMRDIEKANYYWDNQEKLFKSISIKWYICLSSSLCSGYL